MITFDFWLKSFWLWFSFTLLWKRGPKVEYPQPFPHDFTQIFDDNGVLSSWNWVLATVQMPALMPSGLPLRAQAFKEIEPAHSNYPTSLTRSDSTTILFLSFEQYWNYLVSYFSQSMWRKNNCTCESGSSVIVWRQIGTPWAECS